LNLERCIGRGGDGVCQNGAAEVVFVPEME